MHDLKNGTSSFMNSIALAAIALLCGAPGAIAQDTPTDAVPQAVKEAFSKQFLKAANVEWEMESDGTYEAEFTNAAAGKRTAVYDAEGTWLHTEKDIDVAMLPAEVRSTLEKEFPGKPIKDAELMDMPDRSVRYAVDVDRTEVTFSSDGTVLKQKADDDDDQDED